MSVRFAKAGGVSGLAWLAFAVFCLLKLVALYERPMDYDSGYFGTVAKNIVSGYGYATSHSEKILFNPEITTGPAVNYPLALLVGLFGNQDFIPQLYITVTNLLLTGLFTVLCLRVFGVSSRTVLFLVSIYLFGTVYEPQWWHVCIGDLQVVLVLLNAMLLTASPSLLQTRWQAALLGFLLAFGVLVKFSMLMALPALLVALGLQVWQRRVSSRQLPVILAVFLLVLAPFFVYKQLVLQQLPAEEKAQMQANALSAGASRQAAGIGLFLATDDKVKHLQKSFRRSHAVLSNLFSAYGLPQVTFYLLLGFSLLSGIFFLSRVFSAGVGFEVMLAWVAGSFTVWYFAMSLSLLNKYTLQSVWFSVVFLLYLLAFRSRMYWLGVLVVALLPLSMTGELRSGILGNYLQDPDRIAYRQETQSVAAYINHAGERPPLAYCGWGAVPRSVFYLLPGSETTPDCYGILARRADGDAGTPAAVSFWLLRDKVLQPLFPVEQQRFETLVRYCLPQPLYNGRFYDLYDCPWPSVKRVLDDAGLVEEIRRYDDPLF